MPQRENTQSGPNVFKFKRMRVGKSFGASAIISARGGQLKPDGPDGAFTHLIRGDLPSESEAGGTPVVTTEDVLSAEK